MVLGEILQPLALQEERLAGIRPQLLVQIHRSLGFTRRAFSPLPAAAARPLPAAVPYRPPSLRWLTPAAAPHLRMVCASLAC
jgi:hypothetical protein